jgi:hypothetical protein
MKSNGYFLHPGSVARWMPHEENFTYTRINKEAPGPKAPKEAERAFVRFDL